MTTPSSEAKINDIHSWWEVPCIAHFCSLFRASFNLIDFDIEDLEEALLTDDASDSGNTLIQELIVRLLRGYYGNNSISTFNYQMFLRRLFRQKCREFDCYNPFDNDMDFQFLPMRTKVEILHMLCDFRLDADDVLEILKDLDSDSLRVHPLGFDANKSAYWYFYGTRLYREDYPKKKKEKEKKRGRKRKRGRNKEEESEDDDDVVELGSGVWQVVCFTESDWERLAVNTEDAIDKNEQALHQIIEEDFLPEIPKLFQEKERLQRKRFLELHPRKSSRIESLKKRKQEEKKFINKYQRTLLMEGSESEADSEVSSKKEKNARYQRWKNRSNQKEDDSYYSDEDITDCDSLQGSVYSDMTQSGNFIVGRGRQTNNSLSSATGEMILQSLERCSPEWFDTKLEDLHNGMYKVLNKLKEHEDSWPFLEPVDEEDAPNYYKVVKTPMNLQRMEDKLDNGKYKSLSEFEHDFRLILDNCKQYNGSENEYTLMGENLEMVFNSCVNRFITMTDSSDGEGIAESKEFLSMADLCKKSKRKRKRKISNRSAEDADKENEQKLSDASYTLNSMGSDTRNTDDTFESRLSEHFPIKRGKGRPPKNASALHALDIVTEQALRDVIKMLDDTPKCNDFCPPSASPPPLLSPINSEIAADISEVAETAVPTKTPKSSKPKNPTKQRPSKENHHKHLQLIKQRRRDIQRTIDRLQPGKSKGNLISTIGKSQANRPNGIDEASSSKEPKAKNENPHRAKPMLSLGSVLSADIINLDTNTKKHTFSDNDSLPSDDEDLLSDNEENADVTEMQAENLALDKNHVEQQQQQQHHHHHHHHHSFVTIEEKKSEEKIVDCPNKSENTCSTSETIAKTTPSVQEKIDKPKPNLGAWFKAFGAPKSQPNPKKKNETQFNENPNTPTMSDDVKEDDVMTSGRHSNTRDEDRYDVSEAPPPTPGRFFMYDDDKDQKNALPGSLTSPEMRPQKRQRKLSTGSSMSERSSFSQDPNDPMNSPHPSLDDPVYQSPQHYQPPILNSGMKVGFYQDAFPKCGSDKSNSCSPRDPLNSVSPQHPMFSPRDSIASPRDSVCSPRGPLASPSPREPNNLSHSSPHSAVPSPRYAAVSPRDTYSESMNASQYQVKSPVCVAPQVDLEANVKTYRTATPQTISEKSFIYPVKKRISVELEQSTRQQSDQQQQPQPPPPTQAQLERPRETFNSEPERHYLPHHILPPPSTAYTSEASHIPMSLSHHSHHPTYMDSYPDARLMNPYFRKDLYAQGITAPVSSQNSLFMTQTDESQTHYSSPGQSSPLVSSAYGRSSLDFAAATSTPLSLTNKTNESYTSQYHQKYVVPAESALNFSAKTSQHPFYSVQSERKVNIDPSALQPYEARAANMHHGTTPTTHVSYPSAGGPPYPNAHVDYFNGNKPPSYQMYANYGAPVRDEKQYYQGPQTKAQGMEGYLEQMRTNYEQPKMPGNPAAAGASSIGHYDTSYQNSPPAKPPKKSKKRRAAAAEPAPPTENPSVYQHYVEGAQAAVAPPQDLKHNGIMASSAFNFNPPASLKSDYQQYFDNLRNSRYFAESAAAAAATAMNEKTPPAAATAPNNYPFLQRGSRSSFSLAAQAFPTCPPSIYSSPYLARPTDELLRPMMLQQGLMPHAGGYPSGYLNMHDPINRSPWI